MGIWATFVLASFGMEEKIQTKYYFLTKTPN